MPELPVNVTLEEVQQYVKMIEWAGATPSFHAIQMRTFKTLHHKPKEWKIKYEIEALEWIDENKNNYRISKGTGYTLTEAMQKFSAHWARTDGIPF